MEETKKGDDDLDEQTLQKQRQRQLRRQQHMEHYARWGEQRSLLNDVMSVAVPISLLLYYAVVLILALRGHYVGTHNNEHCAAGISSLLMMIALHALLGSILLICFFVAVRTRPRHLHTTALLSPLNRHWLYAIVLCLCLQAGLFVYVEVLTGAVGLGGRMEYVKCVVSSNTWFTFTRALGAMHGWVWLAAFVIVMNYYSGE